MADDTYFKSHKGDISASIQGIRSPYRPIHIFLSRDLTESQARSLPPFLRDAKPEERYFSFMINPTTLRIALKKIINQYRVRSGWIFEHVSDDLPTLSLSGTTASFRYHNIVNSNRGGYTDTLITDAFSLVGDEVVLDGQGRINSLGYRNLINLIDLYRNNGRIFYEEDAFQGDLAQNRTDQIFSFAQRIQSAYPVRIVYDPEEMYDGYFTSMSVTESEETPYRMDFELNFDITSIYEYWRIRNSTLAGEEGG